LVALIFTGHVNYQIRALFKQTYGFADSRRLQIASGVIPQNLNIARDVNRFTVLPHPDLADPPTPAKSSAGILPLDFLHLYRLEAFATLNLVNP
jgi:hypothetical protein